MGAITPLGNSIDDYWSSLVRGESGIGPITQADTTDFPSKIAGEASDFDPGEFMDPKEHKRMARFSQLAVAAAGLAIADAGLDLDNGNRDRIGVVMGNGVGGIPTMEDNSRTLISRGGMKMSPYFIPMILPNMAAANVSRLYGLTGYTSTIVTACAAGTQGIGEAAEIIRRGAADVVLGGGCEAGICELGLGGFNIIRALSRYDGDPKEASRPFDANRDGMVPAEGAALLVIESMEHAINRGATILAEILGHGVVVQGDADRCLGDVGGRDGECLLDRESAGVGSLDADGVLVLGLEVEGLGRLELVPLDGEEGVVGVPCTGTQGVRGSGKLYDGSMGPIRLIIPVKLGAPVPSNGMVFLATGGIGFTPQPGMECVGRAVQPLQRFAGDPLPGSFLILVGGPQPETFPDSGQGFYFFPFLRAVDSHKVAPHSLGIGLGLVP